MNEEQLVIERVAPPQPDALQNIVALGKRLLELDTEIEQQTEQLGLRQTQRKDISERLIPDLLNGIGMTEFTLTSGQKIKLKQDIFANISKERQAAAHQWLRDHNMGGIIKEVIVVSAASKDDLLALNIPFSSTEAVHSATLKATIREQLEAGNEIPEALFGVHKATKAVVE